MNVVTKLTKVRTWKPMKLHKHSKTLCSKENQRKPSEQTERSLLLQGSDESNRHETRHKATDHRAVEEQLLKKKILHTYNCKRVMVAESEDLIIKNCMITEKYNKSVGQGRRGGKPLQQDEKAFFERLTRRHSPD